MLSRSIGKVIRGKATPLQLALACILGSLIGFLPGYVDGAIFLQAPALVLSLLVLLIVLNANLTLAALIGLVAKAASLAAMPLSFQIGVSVLDGPLQGLMKTLINAPVLALFGLEYYATTGCLVVGLLFGIASSIAVVSTVRAYRVRMSKVEEGSELYQKFASKKWVRALSWVLLGGGKGKKRYSELLNRKAGLPVRPIGVAFAVLLIGLLVILQAFFRDELVTVALRRGLESANGATVDLKNASLDLKNGRLLVTDLALADAAKLETDLFRAKTLEATIDTTELLRKRITLTRVASADASTGEKRARRGFLLKGRAPAPRPAPAGGEKSIDDYLKDAQKWKERLAQVERWLEKVNSGRDQTGGPGTPGEPKETAKERLARQVRELGWTRVAATHLVESAPTVLVRELAIEGLRTQPLPGRSEPEMLDVRASNLSTQPWLVAESAKVSVTSRGGTLDFIADLAGASRSGGKSEFEFAYKGLPADLIGEQLKFDRARPLQGGTMDLSAKGSLLGATTIDLPLEVVLRDTTITLPEAGSEKISVLTIPVGVHGSLSNPAVRWDNNAFADALKKAGATALANKARGEAEKAVGKAAGDLTRKLDDKLGDSLGGTLGESVPAGVGDRLKTGLGGLLAPKPDATGKK